jgi:plastocyanin
VPLHRRPAPAALRGFAGASFFASFILLAACRDAGRPDPRVLVLGSDTIVLPDSIALVEIRIGRRDDGGMSVEPASVDARTGDVVRIESLDNGAHAIAFDASRLTPEAVAFLETTGQLRGPPLLDEGAAWVINLEHAPPGSYRFVCATHGESGTITVAGA